MGATPVFTLPWPELGDLADGPDGYEDLAVAVENALIGQRDTADDLAYTPSWRSSGTYQPSGMNWTARYSVRNGRCHVNAFGGMTGATGGGSGFMMLGLPVRARASMPEQLLAAKLNLPWGNWAGWMYFGGGSMEGIPYFPISVDRTDMAGWSSADNSGAPGTGIPRAPGWHGVGPGNFSFWGSYLV